MNKIRDIKFRCYVKFLGEMHEVKEMVLDKDTVMIEAYPYGLDRDDAPVKKCQKQLVKHFKGVL